MAKKDAGEREVAEAMAEEQDQGFRGQKVDPTPNENYTVAGVTSGAPTPETDDDARNEALAASSIGRVEHRVGEHKKTLIAEQKSRGSASR